MLRANCTILCLSGHYTKDYTKRYVPKFKLDQNIEY